MTEKSTVPVIVSRRVKMRETVTIHVPVDAAHPESVARDYVEAALAAGQPIQWELLPDRDYGLSYERRLEAKVDGDFAEVAPLEPPPSLTPGEPS